MRLSLFRLSSFFLAKEGIRVIMEVPSRCHPYSFLKSQRPSSQTVLFTSLSAVSSAIPDISELPVLQGSAPGCHIVTSRSFWRLGLPKGFIEGPLTANADTLFHVLIPHSIDE
jgi:hypothetical protein